jgi:HK97 family phage major capsid protein
MPEMKDLAERIDKTWHELMAKNDEVLEAARKGEAARGEDKAAIAKLNAALDAQKASMDALALRVERANVVKPGEVSSADAEMNRAYKAAFYKWVRGGTKEMGADDIRTLRNALPPERKALVENTAGLYLVPEDMEAEIMRAVPQINTLRNYCRVRPTSRDKVGVRSLTEVSVGWGKLETGSAITESAGTPTKDTIYVEDLYGLSKIGEDELQDTDANLAGILADSFSVAIANEEAKRFAIGRGHTTYSEPDGVAVDATIIASYKLDWTTADTVLINNLLTCEYTLPAQYLSGSAWLMNRKTELAARLLRAEVASGYYGNYLWQPSLMAGQPNNFDGFPIINQNDMQYPADAVDGINVIFGNLRLGYMIVDRQGMSIQRLDELYAEAGLVGFKVHKRVGGGVYRAEAFYGIYNQT